MSGVGKHKQRKIVKDLHGTWNDEGEPLGFIFQLSLLSQFSPTHSLHKMVCSVSFQLKKISPLRWAIVSEKLLVQFCVESICNKKRHCTYEVKQVT